jgi:hypothetical protein
MKPHAIAFCLLSALALSGCVAPGYGDDGYYYTGANYTPDCDYYTPPWGYPADYCRYRVWNQPVYYGGVWFNGPIYYRTIGDVNWFWLNGNWRRDQWRGRRDTIDYRRSPNQYWRGDIHRGGARTRTMMQQRTPPANQGRSDGRRGGRGPDN